MNINLENYLMADSRVLSGRNTGSLTRDLLDLDKEDLMDEKIKIFASENLLSLNMSFFLGLFGNSVRRLGVEGFYKKYNFFAPNRILINVNTGIRRALMKH